MAPKRGKYSVPLRIFKQDDLSRLLGTGQLNRDYFPLERETRCILTRLASSQRRQNLQGDFRGSNLDHLASFICSGQPSHSSPAASPFLDLVTISMLYPRIKLVTGAGKRSVKLLAGHLSVLSCCLTWGNSHCPKMTCSTCLVKEQRYRHSH